MLSELVLTGFAYPLKFYFQKSKSKIKISKKKKRKEKSPFEVNEDLGTNLFSQEEENDAKSRYDF